MSPKRGPDRIFPFRPALSGTRPLLAKFKPKLDRFLVPKLPGRTRPLKGPGVRPNEQFSHLFESPNVRGVAAPITFEQFCS